ncbi:MAG TPA: ferritin-like domain-containing protein [Methylophilus sp.]|uniref:ferritin-like domain-containing protein n=1 Tax=Methylophilus sp. TaxID=29541 RepID=UPI002BB3221F|nr:ferritin-like domain-containing protein [Methylophilus sp.]HSH88143.1 ferritin-like domain-containing protein [Methylophilus sp.]
MTPCLRTHALQALTLSDPQLKCTLVHRLWEDFSAGKLPLNPSARLAADATIPGRPARPALVAPRLLKRRAMNTIEGRAALIHALAHIEFNAVNLALDAVWRFSEMPVVYYSDWLQVAKEEAYHFTLLQNHLHTLGFTYGDFDGHNSLWEMVEKTQSDVLARMALVPRTLEARGLDASPPLKQKLAQAGDHAAAAILDIILHDEIGHVGIGNRWYHWLCDQRGLDALKTFDQLCQAFKAPQLKPPFNMDARKKAGFTEQELAYLNGEFT